MVLDQKEIRGAESHSFASGGKHSNSHKEHIRNISGFMSRRRTFHLLSAEPSKANRLITERLKQALTLVDIRLLGHLVVGGMDIVSFAERGRL